jgi:hypothetical protein
MPLLTCPDCHHDVSDSASACPHCGRPVVPALRPWWSRLSAGHWFLLTLVGLFVGVGVLGAPGDDVVLAPPSNNNPDLATGMCRAFVKQRLKSPSTAAFLPDAWIAERMDSTRFLVRGSVDAQNSFGATLRNRFTCDLRYHAASDRWEALSIDLAP